MVCKKKSAADDKALTYLGAAELTSTNSFNVDIILFYICSQFRDIEYGGPPTYLYVANCDVGAQ